MKILVPVDLYEKNDAVYAYAVQFAANFKAQVTLLYVINSVFNTSEVIGYDPYLEMENTAKDRLVKFKEEFEAHANDSLPKPYTHLDVVFGIPGMAIAEYAKEHDHDLIIMGVRDKHDFLDRLLGSATIETIKESECPVMLIHKNASYKKPEKVVFAFDKKTDLEEALEGYKSLNNRLKAKTDFLHINVNKEDDISHEKKEIVSELFEEDDPKFSFEVKSLHHNNVLTGLHEYCESHHIDLVSMIHRKEGLFFNFLHPNKSVKIAQRFHLPVIVFQED